MNRAPILASGRAGALAHVLVAVALALAVIGTTAAVAVWPALTLLVLAIVGTGVLAVRRPFAALALALILFSLGGSLKLLVTYGGSPVPVSADAAVAALLDLGLAVAAAGLLWRDRGRSVVAIWRSASRIERIALLLLPLWLVVSVFQIPQSGHLVRGVDSFRLSQAYAALAVVGLVVLRLAGTRAVVRAVLGLTGVVGGYAALQTLLGPTELERSLAMARDTEALYGSTFRTIGTFESAVAAASFLTPAFTFATLVGFFDRSLRGPAWTAAALALIGILGSYVRVSLVAIALAVTGAIVLGSLWARRRAGRRLFPALVAVAVLAAIGTAGAFVASRSSSIARERLHGLVDPASDKSLQLRFHTWRGALTQFERQPLGAGLGTVGRATQRAPGSGAVTTDNSYLKVLDEQGAIGTPLFVGGLIAVLAVVLSRLRRAPPHRAGMGLAALGGFASFLLICVAGEYIEQPGKVLAWLLLGFALALAFADGARAR